jgi:hypothetical protein
MISAEIRAQVRERAKNACEYCHLHQDDSPLATLHVEHIILKFTAAVMTSTISPLPASIAISTKERI